MKYIKKLHSLFLQFLLTISICMFSLSLLFIINLNKNSINKFYYLKNINTSQNIFFVEEIDEPGVKKIKYKKLIKYI